MYIVYARVLYLHYTRVNRRPLMAARDLSRCTCIHACMYVKRMICNMPSGDTAVVHGVGAGDTCVFERDKIIVFRVMFFLHVGCARIRHVVYGYEKKVNENAQRTIDVRPISQRVNYYDSPAMPVNGNIETLKHLASRATGFMFVVFVLLPTDFFFFNFLIFFSSIRDF